VKKFWDALNPRERSYVIILGIFAVLLSFFFAGRSFARYMQDISERSDSAERDTLEIENLGRQFQLLQAMKTGDSQQLDNMLSSIEAMLKAIGLREKVGSLTPTDTVVQEKYLKREVKVSIKESSASQVLDFIRQIEQSTQTLYKVESMSYRPVLKKPGFYDFSIQISGFQRKNDGK
jgi:type II secretory pathway component PulM